MIDEKNTTFATGSVIDGKWVILEPLGKGGMGEVYLAHQLNLNRRVAIKVISRDWINSFEGNSEALKSSLERFRREVQVMAQVRHPNVLQIHDYGAFASTEGDRATEYIVMEHAPGGNLRSTMSDEGFHPEEDRARNWLSHYFLPVIDGVKALHAAGIIHRDLKPENVFLCENIPKIADFGLARSLHFKPITQSIEMQGTPFYMSPEHFLDLKRTDERTDIYALGKILYEAISGKVVSDRVPFRKAALAQTETPFFQKIDRVIQNATEEKREDRFPTVQAFMDALNEIILEDDFGVLPLPSVTHTKRMPHWKPLLFSAALVLTASAALGLGTFVYEKAHRLQTAVNAPTPQVSQSQPAESIGAEEHSSVADHGSTPSPDSEISTRSQPSPEGLGQANPTEEEASSIGMAQKASPPEGESLRSTHPKSKAGDAEQKTKAHSTAKSYLSRSIAKPRKEPGLPEPRDETRLADRQPQQAPSRQEVAPQPRRVPDFSSVLPWLGGSVQKPPTNKNGDGC